MQVYLEQCNYKIKKTQIPKFIKNELKSDSDLNSDLDIDDKKLMAKLKKSDSDFDYDSDSNSEKKKKIISNIIEVTRVSFKLFIFFYDKISKHKESFFYQYRFKVNLVLYTYVLIYLKATIKKSFLPGS